jgi:dynein heavy chain
LNCFTDSMTLQSTMESVLEKRTGRVYGPQGNKSLVYFIDDLNMPVVDKYGTQEPIALLRQVMDYRAWYGRAKMDYKEIRDCQFVSCMNPSSGSFTIDPRQQRHFATFSVQLPSSSALLTIYRSILSGHLSPFEIAVQRIGEKMAKVSIELLQHVAQAFLPTAIKFHYQFNLRDLSNIFQGLCLSRGEFYTKPIMLARLWVHEAERVFRDRLINEADQEMYDSIMADCTTLCRPRCHYPLPQAPVARPAQGRALSHRTVPASGETPACSQARRSTWTT